MCVTVVYVHASVTFLMIVNAKLLMEDSQGQCDLFWQKCFFACDATGLEEND